MISIGDRFRMFLAVTAATMFWTTLAMQHTDDVKTYNGQISLDESQCQFIGKTDRAQKIISSAQQKFAEFKFLNYSMRIPAIGSKNQALLQRVNSTLVEMERKIKMLIKSKNTSACRKENASLQITACQRDVQRKVKVFQTNMNESFNSVLNQIESLLKKPMNSTETQCWLCIEGFIKKVSLQGLNIVFGFAVVKDSDTKPSATITSTVATPTMNSTKSPPTDQPTMTPADSTTARLMDGTPENPAGSITDNSDDNMSATE